MIERQQCLHVQNIHECTGTQTNTDEYARIQADTDGYKQIHTNNKNMRGNTRIYTNVQAYTRRIYTNTHGHTRNT